MGDSEGVAREVINKIISEFTWTQRVTAETTDQEIEELLDEWDALFRHYHKKGLGAENRAWLHQEAIEHREIYREEANA